MLFVVSFTATPTGLVPTGIVAARFQLLSQTATLPSGRATWRDIDCAGGSTDIYPRSAVVEEVLGLLQRCAIEQFDVLPEGPTFTGRAPDT